MALPGAPAASGNAASPWPLVLLLYACGLLAAAQLGKLAALAPLLAADLGLALPLLALLVSLIELGGATLGLAAGALTQRLGLARCLRWGVAALAVAGLGGALAQGAAGLVLWRLLEAAGYLGVVVCAPVLIARHAGAAGGQPQALAMTLWSTFVPVGLALGAWGSAAAAVAIGWRGAAAAGAVLALLLWLLVWRVRLPAADAPVPAAGAGLATAPVRLSPALRCLALSFGGFALFAVGVLGLLPTLLVQQAALDAAAAGRWTAVAAVSAVGGSALAALLLRHGQHWRWPMAWALALPALLLFGVFTTAPAAPVAVALAVLVNLLGGVFASLAFALLPRLASAPGQLVRANGLLTQCGASGSLLGPPLMAACVQAGGWRAAALLGLVVSLAALPLAWRAATAVR